MKLDLVELEILMALAEAGGTLRWHAIGHVRPVRGMALAGLVRTSVAILDPRNPATSIVTLLPPGRERLRELADVLRATLARAEAALSA